MPKAKTKTEIIAQIADDAEITKAQAKLALESLTKQALKGAKDGFPLPGLGKVTIKKTPKRPAKKGVPNPFKPGELMDVAAKPAGKKLVFRFAKAAKDAI